jgi:hypothetical protein
MTDDPIDLIWAAHAVTLSRDIKEQMTARAAEGFRPLVVMLHMARLEAAHAVVALCDVDPTRAEEIRALQNQVARFRDLIRFTRNIVAAGIDAEHRVGDDDRAELEKLIAPPDDTVDVERQAELMRLGIHQPGPDSYDDA